MRVRLRDEGVRSSSLVIGDFRAPHTEGRGRIPFGEQNPPAAALRAGWAVSYQGLPDVAWRSTSPGRKPVLACGC
jgi:hypothetical protein